MRQTGRGAVCCARPAGAAAAAAQWWDGGQRARRPVRRRPCYLCGSLRWASEAAVDVAACSRGSARGLCWALVRAAAQSHHSPRGRELLQKPSERPAEGYEAGMPRPAPPPRSSRRPQLRFGSTGCKGEEHRSQKGGTSVEGQDHARGSLPPCGLPPPMSAAAPCASVYLPFPKRTLRITAEQVGRRRCQACTRALLQRRTPAWALS